MVLKIHIFHQFIYGIYYFLGTFESHLKVSMCLKGFEHSCALEKCALIASLRLIVEQI